MQQARPSPTMALTPDERDRLEQWAGGRDRRLARRAAIVLGFAAGEEAKALARRFRLSEPTALKWRTRFEASRIEGLVDAARPGAPRRILTDDVERVLAQLRKPPPPGQARWTTRSLARVCGVSQTTVSRIWRAHGVDPRSAALPPARAEGIGNPAPLSLGSLTRDDTEACASELVRLAREVAELRAIAPPEQAPFLRVALEAIEGALSASTLPRLRAALGGSRLVRARTAAAIAQARALVREAHARIVTLRTMASAGRWRPSGDDERES